MTTPENEKLNNKFCGLSGKLEATEKKWCPTKDRSRQQHQQWEKPDHWKSEAGSAGQPNVLCQQIEACAD